MKRTIIAALLVALMGLGSGCRSCGQCGQRRCRQGCPQGCRQGLLARRGGCGICGRRGTGGYDNGAAAGGPPTAQVTYPYYTVRGPRDFLSDNPRGIGP
jgi:hypothetical protein